MTQPDFVVFRDVLKATILELGQSGTIMGIGNVQAYFLFYVVPTRSHRLKLFYTPPDVAPESRCTTL